ncbi:hypothetical protein B0T16DRAFT_242550 [Cercophora newfieldiana]|uniref:Uncharacterized protein n=1 Tax=Cercophora newfieldiana TaxID=92897 RepID=A0AA39XSC9_9PEZI|nr:hypothetical protein B0T16DRAFT_242550 [Cercophora newfieldiana]
MSNHVTTDEQWLRGNSTLSSAGYLIENDERQRRRPRDTVLACDSSECYEADWWGRSARPQCGRAPRAPPQPHAKPDVGRPGSSNRARDPRLALEGSQKDVVCHWRVFALSLPRAVSEFISVRTVGKLGALVFFFLFLLVCKDAGYLAHAVLPLSHPAYPPSPSSWPAPLRLIRRKDATAANGASSFPLSRVVGVCKAERRALGTNSSPIMAAGCAT